MNYLLLPLLALAAGVAIAAQASLNAQLSMLLKNSLLATLVAFFAGLVFALAATFVLVKQLPSVQEIKAVPNYLWYSGGLLSALAITAFYWLIPKMGIAPMISCALAGQLLLALLAGHFGWFQLPVTPISSLKIIGAISLLIGITLINFS